jgi:hypothetical protein
MSFIPFEFITAAKSQIIQIQELRGNGGKRLCASNWHSGSIFADSRPPFHFRNILLKKLHLYDQEAIRPTSRAVSSLTD